MRLPFLTTLAASSLLAAAVATAGQTISPAAQRIAAAERAIASNPSSLDAYNDLALALARRARETADGSYYVRAETAITKALELAPDNFQALKMRTWVLLGKHEFKEALDLAQALNKRMPDDVQVYGFLTDAYIELGRYKEAEDACQWMLDLRPGNVAAFTRAAYLRELFGDVEGALELMAAAYQRTPPQEVEDRAWILTQVGHLETLAGRLPNAERALTEALSLFPDYHYALAGLATIRTSQRRFAEAADLLQRRYTAAPHPENLFASAVALEKAGRRGDAQRAFATFEKAALAEAEGWDNANRELIFYYANHAKRPADALTIAQREVARRQDVYTLDAYAWALHANKRATDARATIERALAVGVKDPAVLDRAGTIRSARR